MSDGELRQTMQRLMSIHDEIDEKKLDLKAVYAEAKSAGFDKAALGLAIREIRGREKAEAPAAQERAAIVELYVSAFDNAPRTYVHVPAREAASKNSKIADPDNLPAAQSEAAASERLEQAAPDSADGGGGVIVAAQGAEFVTSSGAGKGVDAPVEPAPATDYEPIRGLAAANAIAARSAPPRPPAPPRIADESMPEIPAFLRRTREPQPERYEQ